MCNFSLKEKINYSFLNPYSYLILRKKNPELLSSRNFIYFFDGFFLVWILKLLGETNVLRYSFDDTSLAPTVFSIAVKENLSIALIGSAPGVVENAKKYIENSFSGINIKYISHGYLDKKEYEIALKYSSKCDFVICSMGTPAQEIFLNDLRHIGWSGVGFTCGGYLDQLVNAKGKVYYPRWIDKCNLRWLYRIFKEPKRLIYRYFIDYPVGIYLFIYDFIKKDNIFYAKKNNFK